jgi:hypothetical protein
MRGRTIVRPDPQIPASNVAAHRRHTIHCGHAARGWRETQGDALCNMNGEKFAHGQDRAKRF